MKEQIKLKVPKKDKENPLPEFVSHGNFQTELKPNTTVTTPSRRFADWLIAEYGLTEIVTMPQDSSEENAEGAN